MKIAIIAASGKAGRLIAKEAYHRGHELTAIVRDRSRLATPHYFRRIIEKDIMSLTPEDVAGFDAVVSAYGCVPGQEETQVDVMKHLIGVFEPLPDVRLLVVGGAGSLYTDETLTHQLIESMPPAAKLPIFMAKALDLLRASKVNWTFFSPALRFDYPGPRSGRYTLGSEYIIKNGAGESYISYADYALAMVEEVENKAFLRKRFTAVAEKTSWPASEADGKQRFILPLDYSLAGRNFHLVLDNGEEYVASFLDGTTVAWARRGDELAWCAYKCARADEQTYFVSFLVREGDHLACVSLVLDTAGSLVTLVKARVGEYPARPRLTTNQVYFGAIKVPGQPLPALRHGYSADLVGQKVAWRYSPAVRLTHIYLSERYMRSSLANMPPFDEQTTDEQKREIADRAQRWREIFFEEPCYTIKIRPHLYLVCMIEDFRNRMNPAAGGGDMLYVFNTVLMQDFIRSFSVDPGQPPDVRLFSALGEFIDEPDEMAAQPSPYHL
jgi:uncharacterized protein